MSLVWLCRSGEGHRPFVVRGLPPNAVISDLKDIIRDKLPEIFGRTNLDRIVIMDHNGEYLLKEGMRIQLETAPKEESCLLIDTLEGEILFLLFFLLIYI